MSVTQIEALLTGAMVLLLGWQLAKTLLGGGPSERGAGFTP